MFTCQQGQGTRFGCNRWVSLWADWGSEISATQLPLWMGQVLGEMVVQGAGSEVCWGNEGGGGAGAGTFLCIKAGRACELCRGGSRPHKAQCGEACPTSLAVTGNNTDLAIKAIPNLLVINHPPDSCEWKWKNLIPPSTLSLLPWPSSGVSGYLSIYIYMGIAAGGWSLSLPFSKGPVSARRGHRLASTWQT